VTAFGHYAFVHRRPVLLLALVLTLGAAIYGSGVFDQAKPFGFTDPDSESAQAYEEIEAATGEQAIPAVLLLVDPDAPVDRDLGRAEVDEAAARLAGIDGIVRVSQPADDTTLTSDDADLALVEGYIADSVDDMSDVGETVTGEFHGDDDIQVGGMAVASVQLNEQTEEDLREIELYAAPLLLLISLLVFRSLVAAMLPLVVGGISIAATLAALRLLSEVMTVDIFALNVVTTLGFGLAIDYSLFMVSRYREELAKSKSRLPGEALRKTVAPVGRMVCFSAVTVAAAVASLAVFPQAFLRSTGIGCALVALLSAGVVLTVLPAMLAVLGERVNALSLSRRRGGSERSRTWQRVARLVLAHPATLTVVIAGAMVVAGLPFLRAELTRADSRVLPKDDSARVVDQTIRERYGDNPAASLFVVTSGGKAAGGPSVPPSIRGLDDVTEVSAPRSIGMGIDVVEIGLGVDPYSDRATEIARSVRELSLGTDAGVTGGGAELVDQRESLRDHLPAALAIILVTTVIALVLMTGSLVIPLLTLLCNTLTISMALGVLVLVFQDARLESLLVYSGVGALDISVPILLFAVIFGLSTDYGVFLLSRIAEARREGAGADTAIAIGLERTGRSITAAAVLFAVAIGSFVFSQMIFIKQVAIGTSLAVIIDATLVRALLLPSLMRLCGEGAWWAPGPLRRFAGLRA
jgi:RND superfamily putative drug exporter